MTVQELQKCESMKLNCKAGCQRGEFEDRRDEMFREHDKRWAEMNKDFDASRAKSEDEFKSFSTVVIVVIVLIIALPLCICGVVGCCMVMMMKRRRGPPPPGGWNNRGGAPGQNLNPVVPVGYAGFNPN
jgi:hypothetical protein